MTDISQALTLCTAAAIVAFGAGQMAAVAASALIVYLLLSPRQ